MTTRRATLPYVPVSCVAFDLHCTLIDPSNARQWMDAAMKMLGRPEQPSPEGADALLDVCWDRANVVDPMRSRDLNPARHKEVFLQVMKECPSIDGELAEALYATMADNWRAYEDTAAVLSRLRESNITLILISNVGFDVRPVLEREGILPLVDHIILSYEVGVTKPDKRIFELALEKANIVDSKGVLMVGDNVHDDGGAALFGWRTLILPRTKGRNHGLAIVLDIAGV